MKLKHTIVAGLVLTGMSLFAGSSERNKESKNFFDTNPGLSFRGVKAERTILDRNAKTSFSGKEWDEAQVSGGGFFLNFGIHFLPATYLNPYYFEGFDPRYGMGFDFEFGNYFRFAKIQDGKMGVGMRFTWMSFSYASARIDEDKYWAAEGAFIKFGPQFSYAIDDKMGVDAFYEFCPLHFATQFGAIDDPINAEDVGESRTFYGVSHEVGAIFHYKVFSLGLGYRMGRIKDFAYVYDGETDLDELYPAKSSINNFRITFGFRF